MLQQSFDKLLAALADAARDVYGERLRSLAVYGSVARGTMRPDSDIDVLIVAEPLPKGRLARVTEFDAVEARMKPPLADAKKQGVDACLSPVFKTPTELRHGSFLFLDMTDQARILFDRDAGLASYLADLAARLRAMGAERVYSGGGYYWRLTPTFKQGDKIEL